MKSVKEILCISSLCCLALIVGTVVWFRNWLRKHRDDCRPGQYFYFPDPMSNETVIRLLQKAMLESEAAETENELE